MKDNLKLNSQVIFWTLSSESFMQSSQIPSLSENQDLHGAKIKQKSKIEINSQLQ